MESDYEFSFTCSAILSIDGGDPETARTKLADEIGVPADTLDLHSVARHTEDGVETLDRDEQDRLMNK